jgi:ATP-dependent helicase/nuclease subunit B
LSGEDYSALFAGLLRAEVTRPLYGQHPRLSILGPLEARLIQADLTILGGLNESVWPAEAPHDPWMSRPMRKTFGLSAPERRIGLAAHDFVQLAAAPEVVLTRARRAGNAPMVPSRFILQIETVLRALGYSDDTRDALQPALPLAAWARMLDEPPPTEYGTAPKPEPRPPLAARPRQLSVTDIGVWQRNPYAIYAKHILKLRKLDPLEPAIDAADRGILIHEALDRFVKKYPKALPADALDELLGIGHELFKALDRHPEARAFWWPRFADIAAWFVEEERRRRSEGISVVRAEATGRMEIDTFTLCGRADRIDRQTDGGLEIIDYKTGSVPKKDDIARGLEPQLPLLALIASQGGFEGVPASAVSAAGYWRLQGAGAREKPQAIDDIQTLAREAGEGLAHLVKIFADPKTPYQAIPKPGRRPRYDDYAHLARLAEWGRIMGDE